MISRCTPARAANSTATARAVRATAKVARPKKRILNPAVVDPAKPQNESSTVAATARSAGKNIPCAPFLKKEKSCYTIPDTQYMRSTRWQERKIRM
jgi:hypothetical protein